MTTRALHRGAYRSIASVIIDGPDFQMLTPEAKLVFFITKLAVGPSGIDVFAAFCAQLCERSGLTLRKVNRAVTELTTAGWLAVQENVVWVIDGLRYEPSIAPTNTNHRLAILNHTKGLPRLAIVAGFIRAYPEWFDSPDSLANGYPKGSDRHTNRDRQDSRLRNEIRSTKYGDEQRKRSTEEESLAAPAAAEPVMGEELVPEAYRPDYRQVAKLTQSPETLQREVETLVAGKAPIAEGATPEDVGRGLRELLLNSAPVAKLGKYTRTEVLKRLSPNRSPPHRQQREQEVRDAVASFTARSEP